MVDFFDRCFNHLCHRILFLMPHDTVSDTGLAWFAPCAAIVPYHTFLVGYDLAAVGAPCAHDIGLLQGQKILLNWRCSLTHLCTCAELTCREACWGWAAGSAAFDIVLHGSHKHLL